MDEDDATTRDICLRLTKYQIDTLKGFYIFNEWDWIEIELPPDFDGQPWGDLPDSDGYVSSDDESLPPSNNASDSQPSTSSSVPTTTRRQQAQSPSTSNSPTQDPDQASTSSSTPSTPAAASAAPLRLPPSIPPSNNNTECPECFLTPCVMTSHIRRAGMPRCLLKKMPPHPYNSGSRREKYKKLWTAINAAGGWKDERYLAIRAQRMRDDGNYQYKRDVMPKCVLDTVRYYYPNPRGQPYMGHKWN